MTDRTPAQRGSAPAQRVNPRSVMVAIPCHDGRVMAELAGALVMNGNKFGAVSLPTECSHPSLARNIIADSFLRSPFEWLVHIDSDIYFTPQDLDFLLQPVDPEAHYIPDGEHSAMVYEEQGAVPTPTRIETKNDAGTQCLADVLVCAEYSFKNEEQEPVRLGGGFVRVHRSVFAALQGLKHPDDGRIELDKDVLESLLNEAHVDSREDTVKKLRAGAACKAGTPRLWQTIHKGRMFHDYYPSGPIVNEFVPTSQWMGEDHGFFTLAMLAGIIVRIEKRTRLLHIGRKAYPYEPDMNAGAQ